MNVRNTEKLSNTEKQNRENQVDLSKERILAANVYMSNDDIHSGINLNDCIIGVPGSGKTRSYVIPNLLQGNGSYIVTDTKGDLYDKLKKPLTDLGYKVMKLNFMNPEHGSVGYNPLRHIRKKKGGGYSIADIESVAHSLVPLEDFNQPFWDMATRQYISCYISAVMEMLPPKEHTLDFVREMLGLNGKFIASNGETDTQQDRNKSRVPVFNLLMEELRALDSDSYAVKQYDTIRLGANADKMLSSILGIASEKLYGITANETSKLYAKDEEISIPAISEQKTALFLIVSDNDRSRDKLVSLFYTQAIQELVRYADKLPSHRLNIPVRLILDDFATNTVIPNFANYIATIRSRNISTSIILQDIAQLEKCYGEAAARTIMNCSDNCLYLGGNEINTARYISQMADVPMNRVLHMPVGDAWLFTRGQNPKQVHKFPLESHSLYDKLGNGDTDEREEDIYEEEFPYLNKEEDDWIPCEDNYNFTH